MPVTTTTQLIIAWLKDAHAMERALERALTIQARHARLDPQRQDRLLQHAQETRGHAEMIEETLNRYGADTSSLNGTAGRLTTGLQGITAGAAEGNQLKDMLTGIAAEHFEIACYRSLWAAATVIHDKILAGMCEHILEEEEGMAEFLERELPRVTKEELSAAA